MVEQNRESSGVGDQVKGNWMQFKGRLKEKWGDLTDDDLDRVEGQRERLAGVIAEKVGEEKMQINRELDRISRESKYDFPR